jgi:hypothetical protein
MVKLHQNVKKIHQNIWCFFIWSTEYYFIV